MLDCDPIKTIGDLYPWQRKNLKGEDFTDLDAPAIPCGLIAKSIFTDRFELRKKGEITPITIDEAGIAWASDLQFKFKNTEVDNYKDIQWMSHVDGKFIIRGNYFQYF